MRTIEQNPQTGPASRRAIPAYVSSKIQGHHLEKLAVVYVRQSTPRQVVEHHESTELQYKLADRAVAFGWPRDRVLVIDDDLGQSGTTAENRAGFQRLLAEIGLSHVGLVLGMDMSRLARSSKDWHQLLELCAVFGSLLADLDGLYDPGHYNDRLLLGLKGTMSEAELHLLRMRLTEGKWNKAERGELLGRQPTGYVRQPSGEVTIDPDEQVQSVIRLIFEKFEELGTGRQVFWYLRKNGIRIPVRLAYGPNQGQLEWHEPAPSTLHRILRHPQYAGAYAYGRSLVDPRRKIPGRPGTGHTRLPMEQWRVLLQDVFPAYITWQQYLANQERLKQNASRFETRGAPREGPTLLGGLVTCGRCGRRMYIGYRGDPTHPIYGCRLDDPAVGNCRGQNLSASVVDELIARQVLLALEPAAVELALEAETEIQREQDRLEKHWQQELERARYKTQRARRQYDAVEPENRLVARELERHWEQALLAERKAQEEYERFQLSHPKDLSAADRQRILSLSTDIPALWKSSSTSVADRQEIIRQLVEKVVVQAHGKTEVVDLTIHWIGGYRSQHEVCRSVARYADLRDHDRLIARLKDLRDAGHTAEEIAKQLNAEGFHSPHRGHAFTAGTVRSMLSRQGLTRRPHRDAAIDAGFHKPNEWWLEELALELKMPSATLRGWCRKGWVHVRKVTLAYRRFIIWADADELDRLRRLQKHRRGAPCVPYPSELTTPKPRTDR
jgi:DNA invertase Pin-like site-specific DNA recombinase